MAHINLLPWREELRLEKTRQFATVTVLSLILTGACIFLVHFIINGQINHQNFRNRLLQDEIKTLDTAGTNGYYPVVTATQAPDRAFV